MKIKQGLEEKYNKYVKINRDSGYSEEIVKCGEIFGNFIDEGKTFDEAERLTIKGRGLTGFMVGALMLGVSSYHERGDEVEKWWNAKTIGEPDEAGVKNPAIIELNI